MFSKSNFNFREIYLSLLLVTELILHSGFSVDSTLSLSGTFLKRTFKGLKIFGKSFNSGNGLPSGLRIWSSNEMKRVGILSTSVIACNHYYSLQMEELTRKAFLEENGLKKNCAEDRVWETNTGQERSNPERPLRLEGKLRKIVTQEIVYVVISEDQESLNGKHEASPWYTSSLTCRVHKKHPIPQK